ncbi:hypothetical protein [Desulfurococcus amylolyticus]|uniref:hypothetical protein n=1 Tax=Desulfurococcus amylolyticus TaxID=94694 RepID=UPI0005B20D6F|nr:hypothetical protein [Desulfurococcus amylolyticus]
MPRIFSGSILIEPTALSLSKHIDLLKFLRGFINEIGVLHRPGAIDTRVSGNMLTIALSPYTEIVDSRNIEELEGLLEYVRREIGRVYIAERDTWLDFTSIPVDDLLDLLNTVKNRGSGCIGSTCYVIDDASVECRRIIIVDERLVYLAGLHGHIFTDFKVEPPGSSIFNYMYCETDSGHHSLISGTRDAGVVSLSVKVPPGLDDLIQWALLGLVYLQ